MAGMERVLGLPQRTMMRWKAGTFSDSAAALLRILATYPWMIDVADARFDPVYAQERVAIEGVRAVARLAHQRNIFQGVVATTDPETMRTSGIFTTVSQPNVLNYQLTPA